MCVCVCVCVPTSTIISHHFDGDGWWMVKFLANHSMNSFKSFTDFHFESWQSLKFQKQDMKFQHHHQFKISYKTRIKKKQNTTKNKNQSAPLSSMWAVKRRYYYCDYGCVHVHLRTSCMCACCAVPWRMRVSVCFVYICMGFV